MATGVKPRDDEHQITRSDLDLLETALKDKQFRKLLADYCEEVRDPENQAIYQREVTQLEKERGVDVTFVNPQPGYVIKTSVAGDRKAFVNVCSSDTAGKPAFTTRIVEGRKGLDWQIPYTVIPPREDYDQKRQRCVIYDVVFHPDTLRMAANNVRFRDLVNNTALDGLQRMYGINLDRNNIRFPRSTYKGCSIPAVIRKPDPNFKEDRNDDGGLSPEIIEKLYPQQSFPDPSQTELKKRVNTTPPPQDGKNSHTTPKYVIRQQKNVDIQDYTYDKNNKLHSAIPSQLEVEVNLPLINCTSDCILDVQGKHFSLVCEKPAKYKLELTLPYFVDDELGNAKFDKSRRALIVTLPVSKTCFTTDVQVIKSDSGVESEGNSSNSDNESPKVPLITEIESNVSVDSIEVDLSKKEIEEQHMEFLNSNVTYSCPPYTYNLLDDTIAFTFHIKNTDSESVVIDRSQSNIIRIKFTSIGAGYVPSYYAALLKFKENISFEEVNAEAWDNNVILQLESSTSKPEYVYIGLDENNLVKETFSVITKNFNNVATQEDIILALDVPKPTIEVTNMAKETTVTVTSNDSGSESADSGNERSPSLTEKVPVWVQSETNDNGAKSILRKPVSISRSLSESSAGEIASSIDYISSDCIPEESSLKKTVRFNHVIARHCYRYNSSIEGQKKKNQRKKSKKRNLERRKSESEAEDEVFKKVTEKKEISEKLRRDSGVVADSSDADSEERKHAETAKPSPAKSIIHKTELYDPDKLNKGKYLEVNFKNDLIFDLDI